MKQREREKKAFRSSERKRLLIVGLDGAAPTVVFDRLRHRMPNLMSIAEKGVYGPLPSTDPPVTIPSWVSMFTGMDPGELGLYGFRIRRDHAYGQLSPTSSRDTEAPRVWDRLSEQGFNCLLLGVPGTFPPWPLRGIMVSGPLTPSAGSELVWPGHYREELDRLAGDGGYLPDVEDYRSVDKKQLLKRIGDLTKRRFNIARAWAREDDWDLMVMVEMGTDRMHHGFWRFFDPDHPRHQRKGEFSDAIPDYYSSLDSYIGELLELAGPSTALLVTSDHGAMSMQGTFAVNQWLVDQGDLVLKKKPKTPCTLTPQMVDWDKTRAWADGGFYARVWINLEGREPMGAVQFKDHDSYRRDLATRLEKIVLPPGLPANRVIIPDLLYSQTRGVAPDLMVYFGDLHLRSTAQVGTDSLVGKANDTGPDDANHSKNGIFVFWDPDGLHRSLPMPRSVKDIYSLIIDYFARAS